MLKKLLLNPRLMSSMAHKTKFFASESKFAKFDFEDALNLKSLLTEEEIMVNKTLFSPEFRSKNKREIMPSQN